MDLGDSVYHIERGVLDLRDLLEHAADGDVASVTDHDYDRLFRLYNKLGNCLYAIRSSQEMKRS